jgi:hypothetical protein
MICNVNDLKYELMNIQGKCMMIFQNIEKIISVFLRNKRKTRLVKCNRIKGLSMRQLQGGIAHEKDTRQIGL